MEATFEQIADAMEKSGIRRPQNLSQAKFSVLTLRDIAIENLVRIVWEKFRFKVTKDQISPWPEFSKVIWELTPLESLFYSNPEALEAVLKEATEGLCLEIKIVNGNHGVTKLNIPKQ